MLIIDVDVKDGYVVVYYVYDEGVDYGVDYCVYVVCYGCVVDEYCRDYVKFEFGVCFGCG